MNDITNETTQEPRSDFAAFSQSVEQPTHEPEARDNPKAELNDQIADHEKWMSEHTDDARGVQDRLQQVAVLQQKLVELETADRHAHLEKHSG